MATLDSAAFTPVLKQVFPNGEYPKDVVYKGSPFLGILAKDTKAAGLGDTIKVPLRYGLPQGRSATAGTVLGNNTNQTSSKYKAWAIGVVPDYAAAQITGDVIDRSKTNIGAFIQGVKSEIDGAMRQLKRSLVHALYHNGGGAIGQISAASVVGTTTITLAATTDVVWFEVGQILQAATTDGTTGSVKSGTVSITAIDRNLGTITASGNWTAGISTVAALDFLFVQGDFGLKLSGLDAWIPKTAPSATTFFGVDRTADVQRLSGVRYTSSLAGMAIEEALLTATELVSRQGGMPDTIMMHTQDFANLQKSLGSRVRYTTTQAFDAPQVGFKAIELILGDNEVRIYADRDCPQGTMYVLQLDTWMLYSLGSLPKLLDNDGMAVLRSVTSDAVEVQCVYRAQLVCNAPGFNGVFTIG